MVSFNDVLQWITPPQDWQVLTPDFVVLLFALLAPLLALWDTDRKGMQQFTLIGLGGAFFLTLGSLLQLDKGIFSLEYIDWSTQSAAAGHGVARAFRITEASQTLKLIFIGVAFLAVWGAGRPLKQKGVQGRAEEDHGEFHSLILFATLGMMIVASAQELIVLLLGIEVASMSSYLLAGFRRDSAGAEASMKYFLVGAASSGLTLFGISLLYGMTGTTNIPEIGRTLVTGGSFDAISFVAILTVGAGLMFKISSVPFQMWAPDVYYGAPAPVAGMLASGSKAMGMVAVFNVFLVGLIGVKANWELALAAIAVATMFVGNLIALQQDSIRRMLAYSSIAQAGYLLIAVVVGTAYAVGGGILHLMVNAAMKLGAFLVVGAILYSGVPDRVDGWKGLGKRNGFLAIAMTLFLLSMAGIPPLGGFTSKFILFSSAIDVGLIQNLGWLLWLAVFAVLNSAISLYYYFRVIRAMYVEEPAEEMARVTVEPGVKIAIGMCLGLVLLVGIYPTWFVDASMAAARDLLSFAGP